MSLVEYKQLNENGHPIGESHHNAKLSDQQVERMRDMHETLGLSVCHVARVMNIPRRTARDILGYKSRAQTASRVIKYVRPN